jgi:hypothetical protein
MVELQFILRTLQYLGKRFARWARAARCSSRNFRASIVLAVDFRIVLVGRGGAVEGGLVQRACGGLALGGG